MMPDYSLQVFLDRPSRAWKVTMQAQISISLTGEDPRSTLRELASQLREMSNEVRKEADTLPGVDHY